ncbi:MAG: mechanosensitive ion channel [Desulfobulbaceae bacterium]|jgi:small-conductance mechanosensitive channel|nr:mechanosensitive ion channel [Desulfobulbaceae bacterium]
MRFFPLFILLACLLSPINLSAAPGDQKTDSPPAASGSGLVDIMSLSASIPEKLLNLKERLAALPDAAESDRQLTELDADVRKMQEEISFFKGGDRMRMSRNQAYEGQEQRLENRLAKIVEPLRATVAELSAGRENWTKSKAALADLQVDTGKALSIVQDEKKNLGKEIDQAIFLIDKSLSPFLDVGRRAGDLQARLQAVKNDLADISKKARSENMMKHGPSLFDAGFYTRFNAELLKETWRSGVIFLIEQRDLLREQGPRLLFLVLIAPLAFLIRWSGRFHEAVTWAAFANQPWSTAVFLISSGMLMLGKISSELDLPPEWASLLHIANILAVVRLLSGAHLRVSRRRALARLALFLALTLLLTTINLPTTLVFLSVFLLSIAAAVLYFMGWRGKRDDDGGIEKLSRKSWGVLALVVLLAGLAGFDHFAVFFFLVVLSTIVSILMIWMLFRFHASVLELLLSLIPMAVIRDNQAIILRKSRPILLWAHGLLMLAVIAVVWTLYPSVDAAIKGINDFGFTVGDVRVSPGFIVLVILIFYVGLLVSKTSQYILVNGLLPRYTTERGVRMSIARLTHYAILFLTFLVMLKVLGFKLEQLTIVGGALSVGIGFGLQAIVNNFASGLILLFERPIKVGDTIQFGADTGEVKEVGLRATVIRTYDNAEIVVPNSILITGQVTNWTLTNRRMRLKVPISVAYGSDTAKVMEILLACALEHPGVLSDPKPMVLFLAFAASSLDFQLRVWLPDYLDSTNILSELNIEIDGRFQEAGIEMPFPQQDVHLRSVDEQVVNRLSSQTNERWYGDLAERDAKSKQSSI